MQRLAIETAPKDGTVIVAYYDDAPEKDGDHVYWQAEGRCCVLGSRAGSFPPGWTSVLAGHLPVDAPSHWEPL